MTTSPIRGGRPSPGAIKVRNQARRLAERYFAQRFHREWLEIRHEVRRLQPELTRGAHRNQSMSELRRRHRYEWARAMATALALKKDEVGYVDGRRSNGRKPAWRPEYAVDCASCGQLAGSPCRRPGGQICLPPHLARVKATPPSPEPRD